MLSFRFHGGVQEEMNERFGARDHFSSMKLSGSECEYGRCNFTEVHIYLLE